MAKEITLREHTRRIGKLGGRARSESMTPEERSALAKLGGEAGGPARAEKLSPARRKAIAKKAAAARWGKKTAGTKDKEK